MLLATNEFKNKPNGLNLNLEHLDAIGGMILLI